MWPANRLLVQVRLSNCVVSVVDANGDAIDVNASGTIRNITSDEVITNADGDMFINGPNVASVRATRDGSGDGRVYSILYDVFDDFGNSATGLCRLQVPRSLRLVAIDSGVHECVGSGC
jgi:hypothetical protein